jgi:hypothetical protein
MKAEKLALPADAAPIEIDLAQLRVASQKIGQLILELHGMRCGSIDDPITERRRLYIAIINRVGTFFREIGAEALAIHFGDLASMFFGIEEGQDLDPIMRPKPNARGGRRKDRYDIWRPRARAAHGIECLILSERFRKPGLTQKEEASKAARYAAEKFPELCKLLRPVGDSGKNVKRKITLDSSLLSWHSAVPKSDDPIVMGSERDFRDLMLPAAQSKDDFFVLGAACLKSAADEAARLQFVMTKKPSKEGVLLRRLPPSQIKALDRWIAKQKSKISRPEAIRQIMTQALTSV